MTDDTGPKTRRADPVMTMTIRIGRIGTVALQIRVHQDRGSLGQRFDARTIYLQFLRFSFSPLVAAAYGL